MKDSQDSSAEVKRLRYRLDAVQELLLNQQQIVLLVLAVVALFVPVSSVKWETSGGYPYSDDRGIFGSLRLFFENDAEDFDSLQVHPNGLHVMLAITRIGLVLLLLVMLATILALATTQTGDENKKRAMLYSLGIALLVAAALAAVGLVCLPDDEMMVGPAAPLGLVIVTGLGLLYHAQSLGELN